MTLSAWFWINQVAGTEDGIKEPTATFSACFGAAFIMLHPTKYAAMLAEKMQKHGATGWLVNTGWSGGRYASSVGLVKWYSEQCYGGYKRDFYLELPFVLIFFFS